MIDWNGNGKIDPVDVGISMALSEEENKQKNTSGSGCLPSCISIISVFCGLIFVLFVYV